MELFYKVGIGTNDISIFLIAAGQGAWLVHDILDAWSFSPAFTVVFVRFCFE
jgi:hypothetical protein